MCWMSGKNKEMNHRIWKLVLRWRIANDNSWVAGFGSWVGVGAFHDQGWFYLNKIFSYSDFFQMVMSFLLKLNN